MTELPIYLSVQDFKENFDTGFKTFQEKFISAGKIDFIKKYGEIYKNCYYNVFYMEGNEVFRSHYEECNISEIQDYIRNEEGNVIETKRQELEYSIRAIIRFLNDNIKNYNKEQKVKNTEPKTIEEFLDLSSEGSKDKIIYLNELGIIEFLQKKDHHGLSINSLATVIGAITGIKASTAQSYLNPMLSPSADQNRNDSYNNIQKVEKVKQNILKLGFKLTK